MNAPQKRRLQDVFKTVGLPAYTYVKPRYFGEVRADIETEGKHLLIEGPSGIGKTCVAFAVFKELGWTDQADFYYLSCRDANAGGVLYDYLEKSDKGSPPYSILVVDDFHILPETMRNEVGSKLKLLSDRTFSKQKIGKVILIGIPASGTSVLNKAHDLGPRLGSYRFTTAADTDISRLIDEGENQLNIIFENRDAILSESNGNFWLAQYICNKICAINDIHETKSDTSIVDFSLPDIRSRLMAELNNNYMSSATTFAKGVKWRPGGNKPYLEILSAICKIPDLVVPFDKVLSVVQDRRKPGLRAVKGRISQVIYNPAKGVDLRTKIAFEDEYFSLEDPLFRYFLSNLDEDILYKELGVTKDRVAEDQAFTYEIGFSFAGEARAIVENVNHQLKSEDSITFYDFDQQAFLLAEDLEKVLPRVYSESCRYYLVFLDENYIEKIWTKFERDIMTRAGRTRHIIPVVLDKAAHGKVVGISSTIGMIDLSEIWTRVKSNGVITEEDRQQIKVRLIEPLIEKVSTSIQGV